jgi:hypothetical protein
MGKSEDKNWAGEILVLITAPSSGGTKSAGRTKSLGEKARKERGGSKICQFNCHA